MTRRLKVHSDPWPSGSWKVALRRRLLTWYRKHARPLPWRETRDAYAIWVSEIMLQQTQVATVVPYYRRFLARFPTVADLAASDEQDVLRLWEGLGYYRRARQLHAAAKKIVSDHGGEFPRHFDVVRQLPGIGRYTAGAILSLAFDARQPIVEANTARLFARLLAYRGNLRHGNGQKLLWAAAEALLPAARQRRDEPSAHGTGQSGLYAAFAALPILSAGVALRNERSWLARADPP